MDFFPPVVDDPYAFGAIAAANALSDVYAMGGKPLMALNLAAFPDDMDKQIITEIFRGGAEKVREAGAIIAGGHSVADKEPKYGLSVTGEIHPDMIRSKGGAKPGDKLILTKPLGTGVITTAGKFERVNAEHLEAAIAGMSHLNKTASEIAQRYSVNAMTDITGYSLPGHGHEMAHPGEADFHISRSQLLWYPGAQSYAEENITGGAVRNRDYFSQWVQLDETLTDAEELLMYDPQTSGGLLMAVSPNDADKLLDELISQGETCCINW